MQKRDFVNEPVLVLAMLLLLYVSTGAQTMKTDKNLKKRITEMEDRIALKELVDTFSILADKKDVKAQTLLFTANG